MLFRRPSSAIALVTVVVAVAGLAAAFPGSAAAAAPKCQGKAATIVGTMKNDVLRGTPRVDVIVAKRGSDTIVGRGGNDVICAGPGADVVRSGGGGDKVAGGTGADVLVGATGPDRLRGQAGNDVIKGGDGGDTIDGGLGFDTCDQGAGSGTIANCEKIEEPTDPPAPVAQADLAVTVTGPAKAKPGQLTYTVRVRNLGPDTSAYALDLAYVTRRATCTTPGWVGELTADPLAAGTSRGKVVDITCTKQRNGASVTIKASVAASVADPNTGNDAASKKTSLR
jgi:hypothetical protein